MSIRYIVLLIVLFTATGTYAQDTGKKDKDGVFTYIDKMPTAGYDYQHYMNQNIRYPKRARKHNIEGKIKVKFVVNEDGHISDATIVSGGDPDLEREALRIVSSFPDWQPGSQNGKKVKVYFTIPINFKLK